MAGIPTGQSRMKKYIFFLDQPNTESMLLADAQLRKTGVRVLSHYGSAAVVGLARKEHVEAAYRTGLFDAATSGPVSDESLELCDPDQLEAAYLWNSIHPARLHDGREDLPEEEGEWHELNPFLEQIPYDLRKFKEELLRVLQIDEPALLEKYRDTEMPDFGGEDFVAFEDKLARKFDDPTKAYHLARAARHLKPAYRQALLDLPLPLPNDDPPLPELIPWRMQGKVAVGIIYVESTPPIGPDFSSDERNWISAQLTEGMDWLAANAPDGAGLTWVRHVQHIKIDEPEQPGKPADYWLVPAMGKISFAGNSYAPSLESLSDYCEHMRAQYSCDYAFAILVTPYATSGPVDIPVKYTFAGRHITFVNDKSFGMTGKYQHLHRFMIREMCKVFEAADERWPCSSDSRHGYYNIPNGNCNKYSCIMRRRV